MALLLPISTSPLDDPDHSFLHRVVAVDDGTAGCQSKLVIGQDWCGNANSAAVSTLNPVNVCDEVLLGATSYWTGFKFNTGTTGSVFCWVSDCACNCCQMLTMGMGSVMCWWYPSMSVCVHPSCVAEVVCYVAVNQECIACCVDFGMQSVYFCCVPGSLSVSSANVRYHPNINCTVWCV